MGGDSAGDGNRAEASESPDPELKTGESPDPELKAGESPDPEARASNSPDIPTGRTPEGAVTRDSVDDVEDGDLPFYEWVGMLAGGLGIFLTPLLTGPVVGYCYLKIRDEKPRTALLLLALVLGTAVFWAFASAVLIAPNL
jgi:hypothetical protein